MLNISPIKYLLFMDFKYNTCVHGHEVQNSLNYIKHSESISENFLLLLDGISGMTFL